MTGNYKNKINLAAAAVIAVAALYSIGWYIWSPLTRPSIEDYERFSSYVHDRWQPRDVIAVAPFWAERLREYVGDLEVINPPRLADEDLSGNSRLWLLSVFGYANNDNLLDKLKNKYRFVDEMKFGKLALYQFNIGASSGIAYDFRKNIDKAHVYIQRSDGIRECSSWQGDRWQCPEVSWQNVGGTILDIDDNPRKCIWAHPITNAALTVEFKDVPISKKLVVHSGLAYTAVRMMKDGAPVYVEVLVGGRSVLRVKNENEKRWNRFEADTSSWSGTRQNVTFRIMTPHDGMRHFCFTADTRD